MYGLLVRWMVTLCALMVGRVLFLVRYGPMEGISAEQGLQAALWGLRWDWTTATYLTLPLWIGIFSDRLQRGIWLVFFSLAWGWEIMDLGYYAYSHHRSNADMWQVLGLWDELQSLLTSYVRDFWGLIALWLVGVIALSKIEKNLLTLLPLEKKFFRYGLWLLLPVYVLGLRGGLQLRPLSPVDAYLPNCPTCGVFLYPSTFSLLKSLDQDPLPNLNLVPLSEAVTYEPPLKPPRPCPFTKQPNIVLLIIESLSEEYLHSQLLPFLDSLRKISQNVQYGYSASTRSAEGIPALVAGIPTWAGEAFIFSRYADLPIESLPGLLKKQGYTSAFFHGGHNGTMGLENFCKRIGFDAYYGLNQYPGKKNYPNSWGIPDKPFLRFFAQELTKFREPFFAVCFTLSTHHPYTVPDSSVYPAPRHPIEATLRYTDEALKDFFAEAARSPTYAHTLFVITADHPGPVLDPAYYPLPQQRRIPIMLFHPTETIPPLRHVGSQLDILPTLAQAAGYPDTFFALGKSLWDTTYGWAPIPIDYATYGAVDETQFVSMRLGAPPEPTKLLRHLQAHLTIYHTALTHNALTSSYWEKSLISNYAPMGLALFPTLCLRKTP
ncbi:MAG: LTA synthase family protein [Bacteroidia bacterium]